MGEPLFLLLCQYYSVLKLCVQYKLCPNNQHVVNLSVNLVTVIDYRCRGWVILCWISQDSLWSLVRCWCCLPDYQHTAKGVNVW